MIRKLSIALAMILLISFFARGQEGLITVQSEYSVDETAQRLQNLIKEKGLTLFATVDHTKNAEEVNMQLRPTTLLIFGNPKLGTPLMKCQQTYAIDLPQKALIYEDKNGLVWVSYNDQTYLAKRHRLKECDKELKKVESALSGLIKKAVQKE